MIDILVTIIFVCLLAIFLLVKFVFYYINEKKEWYDKYHDLFKKHVCPYQFKELKRHVSDVAKERDKYIDYINELRKKVIRLSGGTSIALSDFIKKI